MPVKAKIDRGGWPTDREFADSYFDGETYAWMVANGKVDVEVTGRAVRSRQRYCLHQIVWTALDRRISRSAVNKDSPSTNAVAPIMRSTGSLG
jgi:hypothetical protein